MRSKRQEHEMGRLVILFSVIGTLMLSACSTVGKGNTDASTSEIEISSMNGSVDHPEKKSGQFQTSFYDEIFLEYVQFKKGDKQKRKQSLIEARLRYQQQASLKSQLRYALLLSLDHPDKALKLLNEHATQTDVLSRIDLVTELIADLLQREQDTTKKVGVLTRQFENDREKMEKLESQIEALKSIESSMFEREESFVLDNR